MAIHGLSLQSQVAGNDNRAIVCLVQVGNDIELDTVGRKFEPQATRPCGMTCDAVPGSAAACEPRSDSDSESHIQVIPSSQVRASRRLQRPGRGVCGWGGGPRRRGVWQVTGAMTIQQYSTSHVNGRNSARLRTRTRLSWNRVGCGDEQLYWSGLRCRLGQKVKCGQC